MNAARLSESDWSIRAAIYRSFATVGKPPTYASLAEMFGQTWSQIAAAVDRLHAAHEIAPLPDGSGVFMANPFSAIETAYLVETRVMTTYANCAWDALGVPAILGTDGWIRTRCAHSGAHLEFGIRDGELAGYDGVIHMVVPIREAWLDIGFT